MAYAFNDDKSKAEFKQSAIGIEQQVTISGNSYGTITFDLSGIITWDERNKVIGIQGMEFPAGISCQSYVISGIGGVKYEFVIQNINSSSVTLTPANTQIIVSYIE